MDVNQSPRVRRRTYRKADESTAMLIAAGRDLLRERGLAPGLGRVTLNDAIERSGIPRSSAYRLYGGAEGPLESFRLALLESLVDDHLGRVGQHDEFREVIASEASRFETTDSRELAQALREVIRRGIAANVASWSRTTEWMALESSLLAASSPSDHARSELPVLERALEQLVESALPIYVQLADLAGLRPRNNDGWRELAHVAAAAIEGVAMHDLADPLLSAIERPTGPNGEMQTWSATAVVFESLLRSYAEPDPLRAVSADLSTWAA